MQAFILLYPGWGTKQAWTYLADAGEASQVESQGTQINSADLQTQVWADKLAAADDTDDLCAIIRDLYQQEDIPYGGFPAMQQGASYRSGAECMQEGKCKQTALDEVINPTKAPSDMQPAQQNSGTLQSSD